LSTWTLTLFCSELEGAHSKTPECAALTWPMRSELRVTPARGHSRVSSMRTFDVEFAVDGDDGEDVDDGQSRS
jgi:hypothetical protein